MKEFYTEFERPFSPARTYNNYYKIVILILVLVHLIILIYVTYLMFSFTINNCIILYFIKSIPQHGQTVFIHNAWYNKVYSCVR